MNANATFFTRRQEAIDLFERAFWRARLTALGAWLRRRPAGLADFADLQPRLCPNRKYGGLQTIPVARITGSVGRARDFDPRFRPLRKHLRERWVWNYIGAQQGLWEPIQVYQVGETYYVEDGNHRVSVAHASGMAYIRAEVWEYTLADSPASAPAAREPRPQRALQPSTACACE